MALTGEKTLVGFGFGAIQAGLFLLEAFRSGRFGRLVVAQRRPETAERVRRAGGMIAVNIAHADGIEVARLGPVEVCDVNQEADRARLVRAVAEADELATALSSVADYGGAGPGAVGRLLAEGLRARPGGGPPCVVYAAENHHRAAGLLRSQVWGFLSADERRAAEGRVRFLDTVIGKMSGVVDDAGQIRAQSLEPIAPGESRAFLVEAFNRILISRADVPLGRGLEVFEERADLRPFEEAKLHGHNAAHALMAYLGGRLGAVHMAELRQRPGLMGLVRAAFLEESGAALIRRHAGADALFTPEGYRAYADDLLARMTNPLLHDTVARVGRDPGRKLGWNDRLVGTMRLALGQGIEPRRFALGAAAAAERLGASALEDALLALWRPENPDPDEARRILRLIGRANAALADLAGETGDGGVP